jgi:MscS family membrane protein
MKQILKLLPLFILLSSSIYAKEIKFTAFIDQQVLLIEKMDESNVTESDIKELLEKQEVAFEKIINKRMVDKNYYMKSAKTYDREIFTLKKIIAVNKRAGNKYALIRD